AKGGSASGGKEAGEMEKLLAKEKYATGFDLLTGAELSKWITQEVNERDGKISNLAAQFLAQNVGADVWHLNSLLDQLVAYKKDREIELADAQLFLEEKVDDNIFNMAEAVARGDRKLAFKLIGAQRRAGEDEGYVFSMILRQFRILVELRDLFEREDNATSEELAQKVGLHPFVVKKSLPMVKKYNLEKLKELYSRLLQIDIKTKTGQGGQSLLVDLFVGKLE
ncbi:MAG: DNA polymerase III subunit delta, partial [Candidatus Komeilibacteria bacterium]|nr:DNA polymerase III subunit delta [Candidatus Komeilibacteria bacterium]